MRASQQQASDVRVYSDVPGLPASDQYQFRLRAAGTSAAWLEPFAFLTQCKKGIKGQNAYFTHLSDWSNTYRTYLKSPLWGILWQ